MPSSQTHDTLAHRSHCLLVLGFQVLVQHPWHRLPSHREVVSKVQSLAHCVQVGANTTWNTAALEGSCWPGWTGMSDGPRCILRGPFDPHLSSQYNGLKVVPHSSVHPQEIRAPWGLANS